MKRAAGACLLALGLAQTAARADAGLQADLQRLLAQQQLAGAVYALVDGDHTQLGAVGSAHAASQAVLQPDAKVHVGSVAKSLLLGLAGLLWWLLLPPLWRWRRGTSLAQPAWLASLALPAAAGLMLPTGWQALGEATAGSVALWLATATLPAAMLWQGWRAWRQRARADIVAALLVLQASALLAAWGLLPLALWR